MPVPSKMADLNTLAASNSPAGSDSIGNSLDDYIRSGFAIVRSTNARSSASIGALSTTDIGASDAEAVTVTGSTTITSLGTAPSGIIREVTFTGSCVLTHSSSIVMPSSLSYTTRAGDVLIFRSSGSGVWQCVSGGSTSFGAPTPTWGSVSNATAATPFKIQYMRVGNVVTVSGSVAVTPAVGGGTYTAIRLSVPVPSNFTGGQIDLSGTSFARDGATSVPGFLVANSGGALLQFWAATNVSTTHAYQYTYIIN